MYAITGATGKVGRVIVNQLLTNGKKVRAIGRDTNKLEKLSNQGATSLAGDVNDAEFVKKAFKGAEAVVCILPVDMRSNKLTADARKIATNYANAVKDNNVKYAVLLTSIGIQQGKSKGFDAILSELEIQFTNLKNVNVLNVRSADHMENLIEQIEMITRTNTLSSPFKGNIPIPMVCTDDVGMYIAKRLIDLNFKGNTTEYVLGHRDITYTELTTIIGRAINRQDFKYVQQPPENIRQMAAQIGWSDSIANAMIEMAEVINSGQLNKLYTRTPQSTTTTTIEQFVQNVFVPEYKTHEVTI